MENGDKTKEQLIEELKVLRQRVAKLKKSGAEVKRAEEALREIEKKYRDLADLLPQTVFELDEVGNFKFINLKSIEVFAHTLEDSEKGWNALQMFVPEDRDSVKENIKRVLRGEELSGAEYTALRKDGSTFPIVVYASPIIEENKAIGLRGIAIDITERKRAEQALQESEQRYRALVNLGAEAGEAVVMLQDTEQEMAVQRFVNDEWPRVTGYSREELLSMSFFDLVHPKHRQASMERHQRKMRGEVIPGLFEISVIRKDGTEVFVELTSAYTTYKGERVIVCYIRDITERKRTEEQLTVTDRLASIGELAAGIAHELNNPLTSIIGFSQLLLDKDVPDDVKDDLRIIHSEARRTAEVVKNLLIFARKHAPVKQMVNINSIIEKVLELRAYEQKVSNIQVINRFAFDLPEVVADYFQLQQVFLNIVINAEYFMTEADQRGTLTITTQRTGDIIKASFADDGPGISKENLGHLFDPFFTTKEVGKGTGLGLSICHGIITEHGGRIYAESEPGKGATFIVELPISDY